MRTSKLFAQSALPALLLAASFSIPQAHGRTYPRSGKVGCEAPALLTPAGADAGREIRAIADLAFGYYCKASVTPAAEGKQCETIEVRSGERDRCHYYYRDPNGILPREMRSTPVECFIALLPASLSSLHGSHWLKIDSRAGADDCQFAVKPYRLWCPSSTTLQEVPTGLVPDNKQENGYSCRSTSAPYVYTRPTWTF